MKTVPVKHNGKTIGTADIDDDGIIHATIDSSQLDVVTRRQIMGDVGHFSIRPNTIETARKRPGKKW
jgi:hypothetical protein